MDKTEQMRLSADLYEVVVARYLDKTDFNPADWLEGEEKQAYLEAEEAIND